MSKQEQINACPCDIHHHRRYDHFEQKHAAPGHYPKKLTSTYKNDFLEKSLKPDPAGTSGAGYNKYSTNPVKWGGKAPPLAGETTHSHDFHRFQNPIAGGESWAVANKANNLTDHLGQPTGKPSSEKVKLSTEYRDATNPAGKEQFESVRQNAPKFEPKKGFEKKTMYTKDYTPKAGEKGYADPRKAYEDNLRVARTYMNSHPISAGVGCKNPTTLGSTYHDDFVNKKLDAANSTFGSPPLQKLSAVNNWRPQNGKLEGVTVYKHDYITDHNHANCCCPKYHSMSGIQSETSSKRGFGN